MYKVCISVMIGSEVGGSEAKAKCTETYGILRNCYPFSQGPKLISDGCIGGAGRAGLNPGVATAALASCLEIPPCCHALCLFFILVVPFFHTEAELIVCDTNHWLGSEKPKLPPVVFSLIPSFHLRLPIEKSAFWTTGNAPGVLGSWSVVLGGLR